MDRAAHAIITAGVTTAFHPLVYAKTLIQVRCVLCVVMCGQIPYSDCTVFGVVSMPPPLGGLKDFRFRL